MKSSRRQFLRGAGGVSLAIPFLPSLCRTASAGVVENQRCLVALGTHHGGVWSPRMFPGDELLTDSLSYAGRNVLSGSLTANKSGANNVLSEVLQASSSALHNGILAKMNVLRGLDLAYYVGHHTGGHLGNIGLNSGNGADSVVAQDFMVPTLDQILAWSDTFYADLSTVVERTLAIGDSGMSCTYASPSTGTGSIQALNTFTNNLELFDRVFDPGKAASGLNQFIVDQVLEFYNNLSNSSRISTEDRLRLSAHMERIYEIERRLAVVPNCTPDAPSEDSDDYATNHAFVHDIDRQKPYAGLINDIIVAAFACGACRISTWLNHLSWTTTLAEWHLEVAHPATTDVDAQQYMVDHHQFFFENVFLDLANKMDAVDMGKGETLLDRSLLVWSQESGQITHDSFSAPVITAGGAGGFFLTGQYVDYRNRDVEYDNGDVPYPDSPGLLTNQWHGTILQSMGLDPSEYEHCINFETGEAVQGYGVHKIDDDYIADYSDAELAMGDVLPVIT